MRVLLIGCGAVGLSLVAALHQAGAQVDLVARGETARAIREGGIERRGILAHAWVPPGSVGLAERPEEVPGGYDYVLISTKVTGNAELAAGFSLRKKDLLRGAGRLVLFQNGYGNERPFAGLFEPSRIFHAYIPIGFRRVRPNVSEVTVLKAPMDMGSLCGAPGAACAALAEALDRGGIPCRIDDQLGKTQWSKLLYNCTLNALGAILRTDYGGLVKSEDSVDIMRGIIREIFAVMQAGGYETFWPDAAAYEEEFFSRILPPTYGHRSSTLQDIERRLPTEIDSLNGAIAGLGRSLGVETPCNTFVTQIIRAMERLY